MCLVKLVSELHSAAHTSTAHTATHTATAHAATHAATAHSTHNNSPELFSDVDKVTNN
jgi:hypothetical protein